MVGYVLVTSDESCGNLETNFDLFQYDKCQCVIDYLFVLPTHQGIIQLHYSNLM